MEFIITAIFVIAIILFIRWAILNVSRTAKKSYDTAKTSNSQMGNFIRNSESMVNSQYNKVKKYAQRNISKSYLTGCTWILSNELSKNILYTFRNNGELLITTNGIVEKAKYEIIIDKYSILISKNGIIEHYSILNIYDNFLFLNKISTDSILIFANQTKYKDEVKSIINQQAKELFDYNSSQRIE